MWFYQLLYEENEVQRQLHLLKETGCDDASFKEELKRAGINVSAVEQDSQKEEESQNVFLMSKSLSVSAGALSTPASGIILMKFGLGRNKH